MKRIQKKDFLVTIPCTITHFDGATMRMEKEDRSVCLTVPAYCMDEAISDVAQTFEKLVQKYIDTEGKL